jgi:hypothetical protein
MKNCREESKDATTYLKILDLQNVDDLSTSPRFCQELCRNETIEYLHTAPMMGDDIFITDYVPLLDPSLKTLAISIFDGR